ncbi:unnamed protein product [Acanthoscelides obtectus]|uniref:Uncharacterized protein n=1 Tax=Acanthoscelides obtectus TaxID=200917 RepID=A0A9P0JIJ1_ACAOB|nr:unnamed protein product [Acanthoscelides obtectus]CAK1658005.1 Ankyrin repeat, PH and SEC7 domain containing protein secG [Acanthoscelides obtectus]
MELMSMRWIMRSTRWCIGLQVSHVCGETAALRAVLAAGAPVSTPDVHGGYPLHYAAQMCGEDKDSNLGIQVLQSLLSHPNIDVNVTDGDKRTPLVWAASAGSARAVLALVRAGASVEAADRDGLTALHCAASRGHTDCMDTLLTLCGTSTDVIDSNGCTALHYAVTLGHADATALLLAHGADPNKQDRKGRSPAHCGCAKGQFETVKLIAGSHGANLWLKNARGDFPLHDAAGSGRRDLVKWLLEMRPSQVNARNNDGRCPLHMAALNDNADTCKILLDFGAHINPILRTSKNVFMTPLDCALQRGFRSTAKFLQLHGGVPASRLGDQRHPTTASALNLNIRDDVTLLGGSSSESEREVDKTDRSYKKKFHHRFEKKISGSDKDSQRGGRGSRVGSALPSSRRKMASSRLDYTNEIIINGKTEINIHQTKEIVIDKETTTVEKGEETIVREVTSSNAEKLVRPKSAKYKHLKQKSASRSSVEREIRDKVISPESVIPKAPLKREATVRDQSTNTSDETETAGETPRKVNVKAEGAPVSDNKQLNVVKEKLDQQSIISNTSEDIEEQKKDIVVEAAVHEPPRTASELDTSKQEITGETEVDAKRQSEGKESETKGEENALEANRKEEITVKEVTIQERVDQDQTEKEVPSDMRASESSIPTEGQDAVFGESVKGDERESNDAERTGEATQQEEKADQKQIEEDEAIAEKILESLKPASEDLQKQTDGVEEKHDTGEATKGDEAKGDDVNDKETDTKQEKERKEDELAVKGDVVRRRGEAKYLKKGTGQTDAVKKKETGKKETVEKKTVKKEPAREDKVPTKGAKDKKVAKEEKPKQVQTESKEKTTEEAGDSNEEEEVESASEKTHKSFRVLNEEEATNLERAKPKRQVRRGSPRSKSEEVKGKKTARIKYMKPSKIPTPLYRNKLSKSDRYLDQSHLDQHLDTRVPSLPNIHGQQLLKEPSRCESNLSAPIMPSMYSDNERGSGSDEEDRLKTRKRVKRRSRTRDSKSAGSDYESSNLIDSGFEPSPRSTRIPKWRNMSERGVDMTSVTQNIQSNVRRYHLERKIFHQLLELKRHQIRAGQHNEAVLVKRAIDSYNQSCASTVGVGKYIPEDYSFKSFEKFLYEALRKLQKNGTEYMKGLPFGQQNANPLLCTRSTNRCMHATHAYTGVPCAAYLPKMDHHTIPKIGFDSIECKPGTGFLPHIHSKKAVTLELSHGADKQIISLPTDRLDSSKRYYVTFTVKGKDVPSPHDEEDQNVEAHRHSKSD